jgi:uncharacterized protein with LGFP repeats
MFRLGNHTHHTRPNLISACVGAVSLLGLVAALAPPVQAAPSPSGVAPAPVSAESVSAESVSAESVSAESVEVSLADVGGGLRTAEVPLAAATSYAGATPGAGAPRAAARASAARTVTLGTDGVSMVGVTWTRRAPERLQVRVQAAGRWNPWQDLPVLEDGPDPGSGEGRPGTGASDLLWVGPSRGVQVRSASGFDVGTEVVLLDTSGEATAATDDPATNEADPSADDEGENAKPADKKAKKTAPRPRLRARKKWGANERWRDGDPVYGKRIRQVHVHHTANSNDYRRKDVPGILRGIYRYHTKSLGWSDIGYNVLVDRFGRAWVGRAGGVAKRVQGAHTLGFNHNSSGVAVIGNFETRTPRKAVRRRIAGIAAWLLDREGSRARGKVVRVSTGSDLYAKGRKVRLPIIDGHRDTNQTACPGARLYKRLPAIRRMAQRRVDRF